MEKLSMVGNIITVALGLGFVIFIHELGHFLLAKWNGVKVEKFSIGFGPTLASFRRGVGLRIGTSSRAPGPGDPPSWGETEYTLAALPLGGFVKMLGETHDDTATATDSEAEVNPRAYHNKSVWARMQIITAGVIMNVLLGILCFAIVASNGGEELQAKIGGVLPGSPAYKAGLRAGDEIVAIDGQRDIVFKNLLTKVSLSAAGQKIRFKIKSPGVKDERDLAIEPLREEGTSSPVIGVHPSASLELDLKTPYLEPPGLVLADPKTSLPPFEGGDRVIAVGPSADAMVPVGDQQAFLRQTELLRNQPMVVEVERTVKPKPKTKTEGETSRSLVKVTVPVHRFLTFGFRLTPGPIMAIQADSPADKAGLRANDQIVAVNGRRDYDPMKLPDEARTAFLTGKPLVLSVERPVPGMAPHPSEITVMPDDSPVWVASIDPLGRLTPFDVPNLGLAIQIDTKVQAVEPGKAADKAGIKAGDTIRSMVFTLTKTGETTPKPMTLKFDEKTPAWPLAFALLQELRCDSVELTTNQSEKPITVKPELDPEWSHPLRGLNFQALTRETPPLGPIAAIRRGGEETYENIESVFKMFTSLKQGRLGVDSLGGAIPIAQIAYATASKGWVPFIHFLGILSVNLAVLNFLPIPPLDGGQFVFLTAEKVRGKPLPDSFLNFLTIGGVVFVLFLIVFINGKDLWQLVQNWF